ncbi:MAG TPA: M56 family metallopeptidase [Verrucomicrobiae bacterium]
MERLLESSTGFFDWLWRASWQASVVIVLVLLAQRLFARQLAPRWRHALWLLVAIRLALPGSVESRLSLYNLFNAPSFSSVVGSSETVAASGAAGVGPSAPSRAVVVPSSRFSFRASLRWLWLTGAVALGGYFLGSAWRLGRGIRRQRPVTSEPVLDLLEDCKQKMGVFTPLVLLETPRTNSPALLGFIRPRLLLPQGLLGAFSLSELRFIFLHELGHLKRGDILINWILAVPLVLHWFNPLVWYAVRRIRIDGESACDAAALSHAREGENGAYGKTMIKLLERFSAPALMPAVAGVLERANPMKRRIELIAGFKRTQQSPAVAAILFAALALVTLTNSQSPLSSAVAQRQIALSGATVSWGPCTVATSPRTGETQVDPGLKEISVTFDRDMTQGMSWTGREAELPPSPAGGGYWRDRRTCVLPVKLEAGHYYRVELNPEPPYQNFRGADGRPAAQSVLCFTTRGANETIRAKLTRPKVVSLFPPNGATGVDPNVKELRVTFDLPMSKGYSWTGGGDDYPPCKGKGPYWIDDHTCALPVALTSDHRYRLGINSLAAVNFQSADGRVPCDPVDYTFKTRP